MEHFTLSLYTMLHEAVLAPLSAEIERGSMGSRRILFVPLGYPGAWPQMGQHSDTASKSLWYS